MAGLTKLTVVTLGWPVTPQQHAIVEHGLSLARGARIIFDAVLALSPAEAASHLTTEDQVVIDGSPKDLRRIGQAVSARGITATPAR